MALEDIPNDPAASKIASAPTAPVPAVRNGILFGPNGLRAGWRALIFLAIFFGLNLAVNAIPAVRNQVTEVRATGVVSPLLAVGSEIMNVAIVFFAAWVMSKIEKRSFADYGLPWNQAFGKRFQLGLPIGFLMLTALLMMIAALHGFSIGSLASSGPAAIKSGVLYALAFVLTGFFEEFTFRGYLQSTLTEGIGFWPAALILAALFAASHLSNKGEAIFGVLMAGSYGLVMAFSVWRTGNIWFAIGTHAAWDWGETYFYGTPDSGLLAQGRLLNSSFHGAKWLTGGTVGPEGSWFVFPVLLLWALVIHLKFPARRRTAS
jgi:uncharacterized protein